MMPSVITGIRLDEDRIAAAERRYQEAEREKQRLYREWEALTERRAPTVRERIRNYFRI
jgi:hypothetical protein